MRKAINKIIIGLVLGLVSFIIIDLLNFKLSNELEVIHWLLIVAMIIGIIYFLLGIYALIINILKN